MAALGGTGGIQPATAEVADLAQQVRAEVEQKSGRHFPEYTAVQFCSQVVAGMNFFIKVKVGKDEYIHLRVHRNLQQVVSLSNFLLGKTLEDPLKYFQ